MNDSADSVVMASFLHCRPCAPYFLWDAMRGRCRRTDSDDSASHAEAPLGLFFDSRRVTLDDSADSAANSSHLWTSALIQHCHSDTLNLLEGIMRR